MFSLARVIGGGGVSVIDYILPGAPFHIKIILTKISYHKSQNQHLVLLYMKYLHCPHQHYLCILSVHKSTSKKSSGVSHYGLMRCLTPPTPFLTWFLPGMKVVRRPNYFLEELWIDKKRRMQYITFLKRKLGAFEWCTQQGYHFTLGSELLFWFWGDMNGGIQQENGICVFGVQSLVNEAYWIRLDQVALISDANIITTTVVTEFWSYQHPTTIKLLYKSLLNTC